VPALKQRGIHATFFVPGFGTSSSWIAVAKNGNEIANHTLNHIDLTTVSNDSVITEISKQATTLRALDTSIKALTMAYPGCANNTAVDTITNHYDLIARSCGGTPEFSWSVQPSWMNMASIIVQDSATYKTALADIADAAKNNKWMVTTDHGVGGDWLSVAPSLVYAMFDLAIADSMWIDTYLNVAAYWRASFTMSAVKAVVVDSGWTLTWTSPHPMMPSSVPLRIQLDTATFGKTFTVYQKGKQLSAQTNGSFVIEFMDLQLVVKKPATSSSSSGSVSSSSLAKSSSAATTAVQAEQRIAGTNWSMQGKQITLHLNAAMQGTLEVVDLFGQQRQRLSTGMLEAGDHEFQVGALAHGVYLVRFSSGQGIIAHKFVVAVP
jgi:hypothetical protein